MNHKEPYIEPLIRLIELNADKSWLDAFLALRTGGYLPGGGAGSLNDWGPAYSDPIEHSWYANLYDLLRHLFDNNLSPEKIDEYKPIKFNYNLKIIRCLNCNKSYQHPSIFQAHLALAFYRSTFCDLAERNQLLNLFIPEKTYQSSEASAYQQWLTEQYEINNIKIYNFVSNGYICPHCGQSHAATEHDLYVVQETATDQKVFSLCKQIAGWGDFEQ